MKTHNCIENSCVKIITEPLHGCQFVLNRLAMSIYFSNVSNQDCQNNIFLVKLSVKGFIVG